MVNNNEKSRRELLFLIKTEGKTAEEIADELEKRLKATNNKRVLPDFKGFFDDTNPY